MSFFHREQLRSSGVFQGMTDFHSHILPGVDDGIQTMEEALSSLHYLEHIGIRTVWLTPHIMEDFPNSTSKLKDLFEDVRSAYNGKMELYLSAENMMDSVLVERLESNDVLPIGKDSDMLLVETSFFSPPTGMYSLFKAIRSAGYIPLLAHPERYRYMDEKIYEYLSSTGVRFQINLVSLTGAYGRSAQKKAEWFIKKGMAYCYGTDLHNLSSFIDKIHIKY